MRKIILFCILFTCVNAAHSQEFTVKIGGGYAWAGSSSSTIAGFQPLLSNNISDAQAVLDPANASIVNLANSSSYGNYNGPGGTYQDTIGSKSLVHGSYGKGWNFSAEIACRVNPYFAVGIGFSYLFGSTISATQLYGNSLSNTLGDNTTVTTNTRAYGLSVSPNITVYAAPKKWKVKPYVRAGLNLPLAGNLIDNIYINSPTAILNTTHLTSSLTIETQGKFSLGYTGALGLEYKPIPLIGIFAEVNGTSINVGAKTTTLTEYQINGTTSSGSTSANRINGTGSLPTEMLVLNSLGIISVNNNPLTEYSKVINYVDNLSSSSNTTDYGKQRANTTATASMSGQPGYVNENQPHQEQRIYAPFSNLGINIGITICMSKKIFQDPLGKKAKAAAAAH